MRLSHSKLNTILSCPMTYYLNYKQGISLKQEKSALSIGSMVHWGIEHNTEDLSEYYNENGSFKQRNNYTKDEIMAEGMVHGYLKCKDDLFNQILNDKDSKLELLDEQHELTIYAKLPSKIYDEPHEFMGIIDLLLLTNKGFIIVDYKTSSQTPDWDKYLDQLYRYNFLLKSEFPDIPVYKIAIINLKKSSIRLRQNENEESFLIRLKKEYDINEGLITLHEFPNDTLDPKLMEDYIDNLSNMADFAQNIDNNKLWFINYNNATSIYGKSQYYDIFYNTPDNYILYNIRDHIWDEDEEDFVEVRDCIPLDMQTIHSDKVLNKYETFIGLLSKFYEESPENFTKELFFNELKSNFITDDNLLEKYWITFEKGGLDEKCPT